MYGCRRCLQETEGLGRLKRFFACGPSVLDYWWRERDFKFNRSHNGLSRKLFGIDGHPPPAILLPMLFTVFLIYGPTLGRRGLSAAALLLFCWLLLYLGAKLFSAKYLPESQAAVITFAAGLVWLGAGRDAVEFDGRMYRHFYPALVPFFVIIPMALARLLSWGLFRKFPDQSTFRRLLPHAKMLPRLPRAPQFSYWLIAHSLVYAPFRYPLQLLFFPAIAVLLLPYNYPVLWLTLGTALITWLLLAFVTIHSGFNSILPVINRMFFTGGTLIVSLVVIILAAGRLVEFSYIETLVESSSIGIIFSYIGAFYVFFWYLEYWFNALFCEKLIDLIKSPDDPRGLASYDLDPHDPISRRTKARPIGRKIQVHGGGRLVAIARMKDDGEELFQTYEKKELFERIVEQAALSSHQPTRELAASREVRALPGEISRRVRSYFSSLNIYLLVLGLLLPLQLMRLPQQPEAVAAAVAPQFTGVSLEELIWQRPARKRVILLAASGGGTRAALYTHSVLRGLHSLGALQDVVLVSGVSGGGVALAYFAAHRDALLADDKGDVWNRFACDMSYPFIRDVLEGAGEWRIAAGVRLGQLLAESIGRVFHPHCPACPRGMVAADETLPPGRRTFGEVDYPAVILNAALAGHLDCEECSRHPDFPQAADRYRDQTRGTSAGGRLIFTNLRDASPFPEIDAEQRLPYVVIQDPEVPLHVAAALNANFPPVFSNAAVDFAERHRYWVTDGGATDNRGLISLLLALQGALQKFDGQGGRPLPEIIIVMVEASAGSTGYTQDRGIVTRFGAAEKIAGELIQRLRRAVTAMYRINGGTIKYRELPMPEFMRIGGGLGTHWMLPRTVKMKNPEEVDRTAGDRELELDAFAARELINDLHQPDADSDIGLCYHEATDFLGKATKGREHLPVIREWIRNSRYQRAWQELRSDLQR